MKSFRSLIILVPVAIMLYACSGTPGTFVFEYPVDPFTSDAALDLRSLNETVAGEHGFIGLSADSNSFVRGDGVPIRFWSANEAGNAEHFTDGEMERHARFLAKIGVNMVRFHGSINPAGKGTRIYDVDTSEARAIWKTVAFMKKEGIYTTISPFWAHNGHMGGWVPQEWGIEGYSGKDDLWGVIFFSDTLKNAYKTWVKYLYTTPNPYTGIALRDDPAVGLIQVQNEDGVFFWTMQNIKPELRLLIRKKFTAWLIKKYGSYENTLRQWDNFTLKEDDPDNSLFGIFSTWDMTRDLPPEERARMRDQVIFFTGTQYDFYKEMHDYYRDVLGCHQLVNAGNWRTADQLRLNDLERYTYTSCEVEAVNRYFDPGHTGENSGWRIDTGHYYQGHSALKNPVDLPVNIKQVQGYPMLVTESGWNLPHKFQSEGPLLVSAYSSLTGVDSYFWFVFNAVDLDRDPYLSRIDLGGGLHPMNRWTYSTPGGAWMFPANALMFRKNYIRPGETVVHEERTMDQLYNRDIPVIAEESSYDPNRDAGYKNERGMKETDVNPLAYLTGRVEVKYGAARPAVSLYPGLDDLINLQKKTVGSTTGELNLDYGNGVFTLNAPCARAVSGFLSRQKKYKLGTLTITSQNTYITIELVSLDAKPLEASSRILLQAGPVFRPTGWKDKPARYTMGDDTLQGYKILNTGHMPWLGKSIHAHISLTNPELKEAVLLNTAGYEVHRIPLIRENEQVDFELPSDIIYVILQ